MTRTLSEIFGWVKSKLLSYFLILAILLVGVWAQGEIKKIAENENLLKTVETAIHKIDEDLRRLQSGTDPLNKAYALAVIRQDQAESQRDSFRSVHFIRSRIPLTKKWYELKELDLEVERCKVTTAAASRLVTEKVRALSKAREIQSELKAEYDDYLKWARKRKELLPMFWLAAGILGLAILASIGIKLLLYFVIAPLASRRPPIRILPGANGLIRTGGGSIVLDDPGRVSSVSIPISLKDEEEILVLPEYLQSTSYRAEKRTKWLLNTAIPFSSILSGMFLLTRVRSPEADKVVVSSTKDPLGEVSVIELPEGAAFVCQPRSLVGVIQDRNRPIRITRHWRLNSLQSWLTMQLRFLVFHGPGRLIVSGCRGVRMESAGKGRLINQAATLGFSANIGYANTRCETFVSYWTGKEDLFNDIFTGESGFYVYEEMPDYKHKSGITGRGLEGILDAGLKLFGI